MERSHAGETARAGAGDETDDRARRDALTRPITRRSWAAGAAGVVALLAIGAGAKTAFAGDGSVLHPPGAAGAGAFGALCIRCDRCRSICPQQVIGVAKIEDGLDEVRLPSMEYRLGYCDGCDGAWRCIAACPTGALGTFDPARDKIGMAVVDESSCQLYSYSKGCSKQCLDYCPAEGALYLDDAGLLHVNEDACWGCGVCEYVCPTNAYRSYDGNPSRGVNVKAWDGKGASA